MMAVYLLQFFGLSRLCVQLGECAPAVKGKDGGFLRRVAIGESAELYVVLFLYLSARNGEVAILAIDLLEEAGETVKEDFLHMAVP